MQLDNSTDIFLRPTAPIVEAIKCLERNEKRIALVTDENHRLLGTITDGDVRRAILRGVSMDSPVAGIMSTNPHTFKEGSDEAEALRIMRSLDIQQLPLVNSSFRVTDVLTMKELLERSKRSNRVVLMAGGLGSRLRPLTDKVPKPMLLVGGKPLLETIIEAFVKNGFNRFYISLNYRAEAISSHFGDGSKWDADIEYIYERERMGTAGSLTLLPEQPTEPFIIMNGDILTSIDFKQMLQFHVDSKASASMAVYEHSMQIPYGVVEVANHELTRITEKPVQNYFINAGIYVLSPEALTRIPKNKFFDMPSLFQALMAEQKKIVAFPIWEYWLDIGQPLDLQRAEQEFPHVFG